MLKEINYKISFQERTQNALRELSKQTPVTLEQAKMQVEKINNLIIQNVKKRKFHFT